MDNDNALPQVMSNDSSTTENTSLKKNEDSPTSQNPDTEENISPESKYQRRLKLHKHLEWLTSQEKSLCNQQMELIQHDFPVSQLELLFNQQRALMDEIFYVLREQEQIGLIPDLYLQDNANKIDTSMQSWMQRADGNYLGRDTLWMKRYEELTHFRALHGHTNVTKVHSGYDSLANWVNQQRRLWRLGQLNSQRQKLLDSIGFEFDRRGVFQNPKAVAVAVGEPIQSVPQQTKPQTPTQHPLQHTPGFPPSSNIQLPNPPSVQIPLKSQKPVQQIPQALPIPKPQPNNLSIQTQPTPPMLPSPSNILPRVAIPQAQVPAQNNQQRPQQPASVNVPNQYSSVQPPRPLQTQATPITNSPPTAPLKPIPQVQQPTPPQIQPARQQFQINQQSVPTQQLTQTPFNNYSHMKSNQMHE